MSEDEPTKRELKQNHTVQLQLMDLNDDCLIKIFGYLKVTKLFNIAETCKRAQALAQYTFGLKNRRLDISMYHISTYLHLECDSMMGEFSWDRTENFLCIFGKYIQSLTISLSGSSVPKGQKAKNASQKIMTLIGRHCGKDVTELELTKICIKTEVMEQAEHIFGSLKTLVLKNCSFEDHLCLSTENLEVLDVQFYSFIGMHTFGYEVVAKFLNTAKALKCFSMRTYAIHHLPSSILNAIGRSIHLEELVIYPVITAPHLLNWVALKKLKILKIPGTPQLLKPLLDGFAENDVPIEHLELMYMDWMDRNFMKFIVKLYTIKVLKMGHVRLTEMQLLNIAKKLKLLTELHIYDATQQGLVEMLREADRLSFLEIYNRKFQLNIDTYNKMLKIIQSRSEHIKLTLTLDNYGKKHLIQKELYDKMTNG